MQINEGDAFGPVRELSRVFGNDVKMAEIEVLVKPMHPMQMARDAGAKKVFFASAAPPVRYPNVYGIDMPAASELIAHGRSEQEVCDWIGADGLIYQDLEDLIDAVGKKGKTAVNRFDTSVFNGEYVTGDITPEYLDRLEADRCDEAKAQRDSARPATAIGLHNDR